MRNVHKILSEHMITDGYPLVMDLQKSHGSYLVDTNGEKYLDMFSMYASSAVGYNHPYIVKNKAQITQVALNKLALSDIYPEEFAEFMKVFQKIAIPDKLNYCFFIEGGALAVENALKAAFDWKTKLNFAKGIHKKASQVIHFEEAFHGRSGYTLSLTNTADPRKYAYFPKFNWPRIPTPKIKFPLEGENLSSTLNREKEALKKINEALKNTPNEIACIIIETIQAEGGDNHFREEFFKEIRKICNKHDILLILDEVQTGLGLTGKVWAYQHYNFLPDIIAFGKKAQVCGILANKEKLDQVENNVFKESSRINSTFGGNLVDMIRFKLTLEIMERDKLFENAEKMGAYLIHKLKTTVNPYSSISNIRGRGLMVAFDFETEEQRNLFLKETFKNKLLILGCGNRSIRFRPHLTVSRAEIEEAMKITAISLQYIFQK